MADPIKRLLDFCQRHPEVSIAVLGPGICIKAELPGQRPIVRTQVDDLLDDLEAILAEPNHRLMLRGKHTPM